MRNEQALPATARMIELTREEALSLLASVPLGRIGFTHRALPMIRPVNHIVDDDNIVIRTHTGSALLSKAPTEEVVVYEADHIDVRTRTGWSVMVTGRANRITAPLDVARYQRLLVPWIDMDMGHVVSISAEIVTGYRLERRKRS